MPSSSVTKAVFPVAGLGTRFLPATKAVPKELLPVLDRPLLQYAVEEAVAAGIRDLVFITGNHNEQALLNWFATAPDLEQMLRMRGQDRALAAVQGILPEGCSVHTVRQEEPLGLGHAVWCARNLIGEEPFAVLAPDDLVLSATPCIDQLAEAQVRTQGCVVAVMDVPRERVNRYGVLDSPNPQDELAEVRGLVEKPDPAQAPSTLSIIGRYVLTPEVMEYLDRKERGAGGEIQLTDAIAAVIGQRSVHGLRFKGQRYDCGNPVGWLEANVATALSRPDTVAEVRAFLENRTKYERIFSE